MKYVQVGHNSEIAASFKLKHIGKVEIVVSDSGVGMTQNEVANLFQEGVQFNPNLHQSGQGSGLGLWVSKGFMEEHHGNLTATSGGMGKGSQFIMEIPVFCSIGDASVNSFCGHSLESGKSSALRYIPSESSVDAHLDPSVPATSVRSVNDVVFNSYIPVFDKAIEGDGDDEIAKPKSLSDSDASVANEITQEISAVTSAGAGRVLVVDDAKSNRKVLCRLLKNIGYGCVEASDGSECVELMKQYSASDCPFDLILMDYEMPVMNGPTATKEIRSMGFKVPIFGVTGNVMDDDTTLFITHGADLVLHKPISIEKLNKSLANLKHSAYSHNGFVNNSSV